MQITPLIIPTHYGCDWEIDEMKWGFLPGYLKDRKAIEKCREGYQNDSGKYYSAITTLNDN